MEEILSSSLPNTWTTSKCLLVALICILLTWYLRFLWSRRKLYAYSRKLPGPIGLPFLGSALSLVGSPHSSFSAVMNMYSTYPGIFRIWLGPRFLYAISDPKCYEILLPRCLSKDSFYNRGELFVGHGLVTAPVETWKRHRKIITPTFNQKNLDGFVEIFSEQSNVLVEQLKKKAGKGEFDMFHILAKCTMDMICETTLGVKVNNQTTNGIPIAAWIDNILETTIFRVFVFWYSVDAIFNLTTRSKNYYDNIKSFHEFCDSVINKKKQEFEESGNGKTDTAEVYFEEGPKKKVFLDYIIESSGNSFSKQELRDEVATLIITGSDTTASTISFIFMMLGLHQNLQQKVYEEIMEVVGPNRAVEKDDLPKLKYMERFIKETLRLFPLTPVLIRAIEEDVDVGDHVVPAGISVLFGILSTHTNAKYWPDPYKFDPDRFLPEEVAKRHPCSYLPFSYGPRNCLGLKYAMMASKVILATVVSNFKISTSYKSVQDIKLKASILLRPNDGYRVSLQLR